MTGRDRCRSCHQRIVWAITDKGRRMPIDPAPTEAGTLVITWGSPNTVRVDPHWPGPKHVSHFATCPHAGGHRQRGHKE